MKICKEMEKLRDWLTMKKIPWKDQSEDYGLKSGEGELWMCRTKFEIGGVLCSVINGYGSFGGLSFFEDKNKGLLEIWANEKIGGGEPVGYLTADDVIKLITENYMKKE